MTDITRLSSRQRPEQPICGARTRRGTPCQCRALTRGGRCRRHGGASTGPLTPEGKGQSAMNLEHARAAINSARHAETRRQRAHKGWETRRRLAERRHMIEIGRQYGIPIRWLRALEPPG